MGILCCCQSKRHHERLDGLNKEENEVLNHLLINKEVEAGLADHNESGDDVLEVANYNELDAYQKYEKEFPFYHMDVNGYVFHLKQALALDMKNAGKSYEDEHYQVTSVSLSSIHAFQNHKSWASFNDADSTFVQFLKEECLGKKDEVKIIEKKNTKSEKNRMQQKKKGKGDGDGKEDFEIEEVGDDVDLEKNDTKAKSGGTDEQKDINDQDDIYLDLEKMKILGILQCNGSTYDKLTELYHVLQDNDQEMIASNDKDMVRVLKQVFTMATRLVFKHIQKHKKLRMEVVPISNERITQVEEMYDDFIDEIVDNVFGYDSLLPREDWKSGVEKHEPWVVDSAKIRDKLYPEFSILSSISGKKN